MSDVFFSIIIPVYNVEAYLHQCVDSVLAQTFRDFEVILVDDGSPDRCPQICDEYAARDPRVQVIHKENGGLSDARNHGITAAAGAYLMFLDSDDYWDDPTALETIHNAMASNNKQADIVIFQAKLLYPDGSMIPDNGRFSPEFNAMEPEEALRYMSENGLLIGSACSKVVRRSFLLENNLFFKVGIKSEDIHWIIRTANCLPRCQYTDQYFYIYRKGRSDSITGSIRAADLDQFADMLAEFAEDYPYTNAAVEACLLGLVAYEFSILMAKTANLPSGPEKTQLTAKVRSLRSVLSYDIHPKVRKIHRLEKLIGFNAVMYLLGIYLKYRKR